MHPFNYAFHVLIPYVRSSIYSNITTLILYQYIFHANESQCIMLSISKHIVKKDNSYANGEETPNFLTWGAYFMHVYLPFCNVHTQFIASFYRKTKIVPYFNYFFQYVSCIETTKGKTSYRTKFKIQVLSLQSNHVIL